MAGRGVTSPAGLAKELRGVRAILQAAARGDEAALRWLTTRFGVVDELLARIQDELYRKGR